MRDWIDSIDARIKTQAKYDKKNTVGFYMKLNISTDQDIIRWLWKQISKQGSIKRLIREEIARDTAQADHPDKTPIRQDHTVPSKKPNGGTTVLK